MFEKILNCVLAPVCVIATDHDNSITLINQNFASTILAKKSAIGLPFVEEIIHSDDQDLFQEVLSSFLSNAKSESAQIEARTLTRNGRDNNFPIHRTYRWKMVRLESQRIVLTGENSFPVKSPAEEPCEKENMINDHDEMLDFFQNAPIAMHWLSGTGQILWANNTELNTLGYTAEEYIGHNIIEFCPEEEEPLEYLLSRLARGLTIHNAPFKFRTKIGDLKYLTVDSNVRLNIDGSFRHTRCFLKDETERKIRESISDSERRVKDLIAIEKDTMMRRIFHEIKTPLHTSMYEVETALITDQDIATITLQRMQRQLDGVIGLVDDLSFLFMFENDNVITSKPDPVNLSFLIKDIIACVRAVEGRAGQTVDFVVEMNDVPVSVMASPCLRRVLFNLCRNAVRFSPEVATITISVQYSPMPPADLTEQKQVSLTRKFRSLVCSAALEESGSFAFKVVNTTEAPIDLVQVHSCFHNCYYSSEAIEPHSKRNSDLVSKQGLGLGLYVCYNMVQSMGGLLGCSGNTQATSFWFTVPLKVNPSPKPFTRIESSLTMQTIDVEWSGVEESPAAALHVFVDNHTDSPISATTQTHAFEGVKDSLPKEVAALTAPERAFRVLVVDDSSLCQKIVCSTLKKHGLLSTTKDNGREAVQEIECNPTKHDCVLMDLRMPIMDGITAIRYIRQTLKITCIPIIALTAELGANICDEAIAAGANCVLSKPARSDEMIAAIFSLVLKK